MTEAINITFSKVDQGYKLDKINNIPTNIEDLALDVNGNPIGNFVANNQQNINNAVSQLKQSLTTPASKVNEELEISGSSTTEIPKPQPNNSEMVEIQNDNILLPTSEATTNEYAETSSPISTEPVDVDITKQSSELPDAGVDETVNVSEPPYSNAVAPAQNGEDADTNDSQIWKDSYPYGDSATVQNALVLLKKISSEKETAVDYINEYKNNKNSLQTIINSANKELKKILSDYINSVDMLLASDICTPNALKDDCIVKMQELTTGITVELEPPVEGGMNIMKFFANKSRRIRSKRTNKTRRNKKTRKNQQKRKAKRNTRK